MKKFFLLLCLISQAAFRPKHHRVHKHLHLTLHPNNYQYFCNNDNSSPEFPGLSDWREKNIRDTLIQPN